MPEKNVTHGTANKILREHIAPTAILNTDESQLYRYVGEEFAAHDTVNHREEEYSRRAFVTGRRASTNTVEGYFGNLKRQVNGTHHHASSRLLHRYVHEFEFKYNSRKVPDGMRTVQATARIEGRRLTLFRNAFGAPSFQD